MHTQIPASSAFPLCIKESAGVGRPVGGMRGLQEGLWPVPCQCQVLLWSSQTPLRAGFAGPSLLFSTRTWWRLEGGILSPVLSQDLCIVMCLHELLRLLSTLLTSPAPHQPHFLHSWRWTSCFNQEICVSLWSHQVYRDWALRSALACL